MNRKFFHRALAAAVLALGTWPLGAAAQELGRAHV